MTHAKPAIFCAIDTTDMKTALSLTQTLAPMGIGLKLGMEFVNTFGPQGIEDVRKAAPDAALFIDLKFHDIPNTVVAAVRTLSARFKPAYLNVHASGGRAMMEAAKDACAPGTKLLAVTVLTSMDDESLHHVGQNGSVMDQVLRLALLTKECELDGVVCSAHEIDLLRRECGQNFALMVPGIRPAGAETQDQVRVMTPKQALSKGATHLVIGRPITQASDPKAAAQVILTEIDS